MRAAFKEYLETERIWFEDRLRLLLQTEDPALQPLVEAMNYSLLAGGKRLRPILFNTVLHCQGKCPEDYFPMAAALECIHTYSLIHDDLPCMDNDDLRRGIPTCHKRFDEATATLAGDALLTYAFELLAKASGISAELRIQIILALAQAAGFEGMVGGQLMDMQGETKKLSGEELRAMEVRKTGKLIAVPLQMAAILAGVSDEEQRRLREFGESLGLLFQIRDDILDEIGDSDVLGKERGQDSKAGKSTFTSLYGLTKARELAILEKEKCERLLQEIGWEDSLLAQFPAYILERNK